MIIPSSVDVCIILETKVLGCEENKCMLQIVLEKIMQLPVPLILETGRSGVGTRGMSENSVTSEGGRNRGIRVGRMECSEDVHGMLGQFLRCRNGALELLWGTGYALSKDCQHC